MLQLQELDLHVTNKCMLACKHCCFDAGEKMLPELKKERWMQILKQGKNLGVKDIDITGGEPLLYKGLDHLINYAVNLEYNVTLQTNGILFNRSRRKELKARGLKNVMISIDGWEKSHNWLRGFNSFQQAKSNIEEAIEEGWTIRVNAVAMKSTFKSIPTLISWADKTGIPLVSIFFFTPQGRGESILNEELEYKQWEEFIISLQSQVSHLQQTHVIVEPSVGPLGGLIEAIKCPMYYRGYLQVLCDGRAYPCTMLIFSDLYLADLSCESLSHCLEESRWSKLTKSIDDIVDDSDECKGGCIGYSTWLTGKLGIDPRCQVFEKGTFPICPLVKIDLSKNKKALRSGLL
ncbi:Radical SAM domain protein [Limnospira maxima CS-328]|uniref:Radical SAM domain protein n=1 Tax=Limnospira maxima CS-328 TaxID=513049 RepID=B5VZA9_LIMMA|nr:radical SAM protein [Limnospira maxima]EDZ95310.1 Radical SAM domain protein [Limnospira maxima CS-328]MDC0839020.1 radical SAM protein [Limnoraphis robusta]